MQEAERESRNVRIAVMGSGGVGGYFGARLARGGADVHFVARGAHQAAMRDCLQIMPSSAFSSSMLGPPDMTTSMHHDIQNGRPLEVQWLAGGVVELGKEVGPYADESCRPGYSHPARRRPRRSAVCLRHET
jgi:ketopantoate reductase